MPVMRLVILLIAAAAAVGAALLVNGMQGSSTPAVLPIQTSSLVAAKEVEEVPTLKVLVATSDLKVGQFVQEGQLSWQDWPEEANTTSFLIEEVNPDAIEGMLGAVVRVNMMAGEPLTAAKIVHPGEAGFMSAVLTPGMRAVGVEITAETAAGGFIFPNDHVDVLLTFEVEVDGPNGRQEETAIDTILNNVRVLAIDGYYKPVESEAGEAVVGNRATLELSRQDAMVLMAAQERGEISLVLRSVTELAGTSGATASGLALASRRGGGSDGVRVFQRGVRTALMSAPPGVVQPNQTFEPSEMGANGPEGPR
ncbi:Flp pilus assembly protein CpaB [Hirschia maritima]|uniref:Flp pilus assembly protein CpaB n=1 Tax=Hirschia maritima TaxID=1121961 RepID=UPI00035D8F2E|nr:Flp pilus assembly protein CpaB [Hirschia maritima]